MMSILIAAPVIAAEQLSLAELQELMVKESPRIRSMKFDAEMVKKRIESADALDDPKLKLGLNNVPTNGFSLRNEDMTTKEIGISQMIPLGGKRKIKADIAEKDHRRSMEQLKKETVEMLHMLRMNAYELMYVRSSKVILDEVRENLKLLVESEAAANRSGMGSLGNVVKANIERTMLDEEAIALTQMETELARRIAYLAGRNVTLATAGLPDVRFRQLDGPRIRERIIAGNPELAALAAERAKSGDELALREKEYYPDLEIGFSYMQRDSGPMGSRPDMVSAMAQFNIPLWYKQKNIPMIEEMQQRRNMVASLVADKENELVFRAERIISRLKQAEELHRLYTEQLIPQVEITLQTILARYRTSTTELMPAVDTVRMLLKYKKETLMAKKEYLAGLSELAALMGEENAE